MTRLPKNAAFAIALYQCAAVSLLSTILFLQISVSFAFSPTLQESVRQYGIVHHRQQNQQFAHSTTSRYAVESPVIDEVCETVGVTLTRFMMEIERVNPELQELAELFSGIQTAGKAISNLVKRSQLPKSSLLGLEGEVNIQGEDQKVSFH